MLRRVLVALALVVLGAAGSADAYRCSNSGGYDSSLDCVPAANGTALVGGLALPQYAQCECNWHTKLNTAMASLNNACVVGTNCSSQTPNPALTGAIRLANGDTISARNNANSADLVLLKANASDQAEFPTASKFDAAVTGTTFTGNFISSTPQPATIGTIRLANTDFIVARNFPNSANVLLLDLNSANQAEMVPPLLVDNTITALAFTPNTNNNNAATGVIRSCNADSWCFRNAANNADLCFSLATNQLVWGSTLNATGAISTAAGFVSGSANPASSGVVRLANLETIVSRNAANTGDIPILSLSSTNEPQTGRVDTSVAPMDVTFFVRSTSTGAISATGDLSTTTMAGAVPFARVFHVHTGGSLAFTNGTQRYEVTFGGAVVCDTATYTPATGVWAADFYLTVYTTGVNATVQCDGTFLATGITALPVDTQATTVTTTGTPILKTNIVISGTNSITEKTAVFRALN